MSLAQSEPAVTADSSKRGSLLRPIAGGSALVAVLAAVAIAVWPASAADEARADGEALGEAVGQLYYADSSTEVDAALADIDTAVSDTRAHAGDAVADQAADQQDALARAADGFVGSVTTDDDWEAELYQAKLDVAVDDVSSQASDFRAEGPEVNEAFWEGVDDGLPTT